MTEGIDMLPSVEGTELIVALVTILLLFRAKRVPELARGLGSGIRAFRNSTRGDYEIKRISEEKADDPAIAEGRLESRSENAFAGAGTAGRKRG